MADRGDTHYKVKKLNRWFAVSSLVLLFSALWMVLDDWDRQWKGYQREFSKIEIARARAELASPEAQAVMAEEEELLGVLGETEERLLERRTELEEAQEELRQLVGEQFIASEAEKVAKQEFGWERWQIEEHRLAANDDTYGEERIREFEDVLSERSGIKQVADAAVVAQDERIAEITAEMILVETELKNAGKSIALVRKRLAALDPEDFPTKLANILRDFPGLDFVGPNLKVKKVLPPDLTFELNFTKKRRIDMCQTCHVPIDLAGFENEEQPFQSHPRLDLYLSAKSPHPYSQFGCTICHRGSGEALDFQRTDHRANDLAQAEEWHDEYGWHKQHYWDYPMLSSDYVEASCVQCHEDSMELIAPEAPRVTEGYRLFERYACYSCHKVDWFPTDRRVGPPLGNVLSKTDEKWVEAWIANPKAFRPTTWMPQIFHLENYDPDVVVSVSEYGQGREIMGDEWSDTAIAAVGAFVFSRSEAEGMPPIPEEGDPDRGRESFRLVGCLACHNMAPFTEEERAEVFDAAEVLRKTNEHGPNLRGIATKVTPEWLYSWIKDPAAYWPETRMPNLRLTDQEAADIVAYVFEDPDEVFQDVPEGWEPRIVPFEREVLEEQARWFFNRVLREELDRRFLEEWSDDRVLLEAVGERYVLNQGCHSCHEIPGLENAQPIGTELSNWGSKTIDKLDWGFIPDIFAREEGWSYADKSQFKEYRENWLRQKLAHPRSYDREKVKNPTERLRMPWFDLTDEEVQAISTFVVGLVDDEVERARMVPTAKEREMDIGLRVMREKNCAACHVIEPGTVEFLDEDGNPHSVKGQIFPLEEEVLPPPLEDFQAYAADYVDWFREEIDEDFELEEVVVQLLRPEPGLGDVGSTVVVEDVASVRTEPAWGGDFVSLVNEYYLYEDDVEDVDGESRSYAEEVYDKVRWTFAPPVLIGEGDKLQREWFYRFLLDPETLRPQIRVRMPSFNWQPGEAGAVTDYFANHAARAWPARYTRKLLLALDQTPEEASEAMTLAGISGVTAATIEAVMNGAAVETQASLPKLLEYGLEAGFNMSGPIDPSFQDIPQRAPSYLDPLLEVDPDFFEQVHNLVVEGPNCVQCHSLGGAPPTQGTPIAWAPSLDIARDRLRPDWLRRWLIDPSKVYPGTSMPANFPLDDSVWQDLLPLTSSEQINAVVTWLFNLDRASVRN